MNKHVIKYSARTKAGRAWIAKILDCTTSITKVEIDSVTDARTEQAAFPITQLQRLVASDDRTAMLYEISDNTFVYINPFISTSRYVIKYVIQTYAFDPSDLPAIKES